MGPGNQLYTHEISRCKYGASAVPSNLPRTFEVSTFWSISLGRVYNVENKVSPSKKKNNKLSGVKVDQSDCEPESALDKCYVTFN